MVPARKDMVLAPITNRMVLVEYIEVIERGPFLLVVVVVVGVVMTA